MSSVWTTTDGLKDQKASALQLLAQARQTAKTDSLRDQIKAIDPEEATDKEKERLAALCRRVEALHNDVPPKPHGHLNRFDRRATAAKPQNPRGPRGRHG